MKFNIISLAAVALIFISCSVAGNDVDESETIQEIEIHLAERFNGEIVSVEFDGKTVFNAPANSSRSGLAEIISVSASNGAQGLRIHIEDTIGAETEIYVNGTLYVQIYYNFELKDELNFVITETRPTYL